MQYHRLQRILRQEGTSFQDITDVWRPTQLLFVAQVRGLLQDMQKRYDEAISAHDELVTLPRGAVFVKLLVSMRLSLREANFQWKGNQLRFIQASSRFYSNFGEMLRLLRNEAQRGTFSTPPGGVKGV